MMTKHVLTSKEGWELPDMDDQISVINGLSQISQLAASIGHEVRNPLATVRGLLQILLGKCSEEKEIQYYELMIGELDRANSLLEQFLSLARKKTSEAIWDNLNTIVNGIYPLLMAEAYNAGRNLNLEQELIPNLYLDKNEIIQLILNLVRNAVEASPKGSTITLRTAMEGDKVLFAVKDQGKGIPADIIAKLGTPYYTTKKDGTGLGLAVCKKITDRHNANICIETGESGSTFWVYFNQPQVFTECC